MGHGEYPFALFQQVFVVAVCVRDGEKEGIAELQKNELQALIESAGWTICADLQLTLKKRNPGSLLGSGQIERIAEVIMLAEEEVQDCKDLAEALDYVVIDYDLSPTQLFNIEKKLKKQVIDRKSLILSLFEQRAQTREARLQVHLARLYYEKPRLKRAWTHLSRQRGGRYGTRGEGETQIEIDGRLIEVQIRKLEKQLDLVERQRKQQRKQGVHLPHIALVGYTNAGKSALMHALSGKEIYVADRLFATLDPKSSELRLPAGEQVIVTDTVGFVRNLPHELIDAFRATLEETVLADVQLIVLDASDAEWQEKLATVHRVLQDLEIDEKKQLLLLNKIDLLSVEDREYMQSLLPEAVLISAKQGSGLETLQAMLAELLAVPTQEYCLEVAYEDGALRAWLFQHKLIVQELPRTERGQMFQLRLSTGNYVNLCQKFPQLSLQPIL